MGFSSKVSHTINTSYTDRMIFKKFVHALTFTFLLGAGLLTFFLILSGGRPGGTLKNFYWFEGNTSGFNDAPDVTRWYNYRWCGYSDGQTSDCSSTVPAQAFSPRDNFGRSDEMPSSFLNNRNTYYYLSRVAWAMLLIGLVFIVGAIIPAVVMIFKTITVMAIWSTVSTWIAFFFILLAACLYTGCYAKAKNAFSDSNRSSKLGAKNFAFLWTTVFLLLVNTIWSTITVVLHGMNKFRDYKESDHYAGGAGGYNNASSMDTTHNDKSTYDSDKHHSDRTFFTRLRTKKKMMQTQEPGEQPEEVQYVTRDFVSQPTGNNNTQQTTGQGTGQPTAV